MEFCSKRCKLELFNHVGDIVTKSNKGAIATGIRMHKQYSYPNKSFDRVRLKALLSRLYPDDIIFRQVDNNIIVRGKFDDFRVIRDQNGKKWTSIVEVKTTKKKYLWSPELKSAIRQLKLYMWVLHDTLDTLGFPLWDRGYVEVYSQNTGELLKIYPVEYEDQTQWIRDVVLSFQGLKKVSTPNFKLCKFCPYNVRKVCDWYCLQKM